jgi:hypothetical protein
MRQTSAPCFAPPLLLRRTADDEKTTGGIFVDPPESVSNIWLPFCRQTLCPRQLPRKTGPLAANLPTFSLSHFLTFPPSHPKLAPRASVTLD